MGLSTFRFDYNQIRFSANIFFIKYKTSLPVICIKSVSLILKQKETNIK